MNLTDAQKVKVKSWIESGLKVAELQDRLAAEFGLRMTYMEVRFLMDDLKVIPKDLEPLKPPVELGKAAANASQPASPESEAEEDEIPAPPAQIPPGAGKASLTMDKVTLPGAAASGQVTFSDGQVAQWYLDQFGRLGLSPKKKGYRPSQADLQAFQLELQKAFEKYGF